jgi:hypothetical protein
MDNPAETLRSEVEKFLDQTKTSPTAFGSRAMRDPKFVWNLRAGMEPRFKTIKRVMDFIESHREDAA